MNDAERRQANYDRIDLLADMIEPMGRIVTDRAVVQAWREKDRAAAARLALKNHKPEVVELLARLDGQEPERYEVSAASAVKLLARVNELLALVKAVFPTRAQSADAASSGPATGSTADGGRWGRS